MPEQVFEQSIVNITVPAAADLTAKKGCVVSPVTGALESTGGLGGGILQNSPDSGQGAVVAVMGVAIGLAGASVTKGQYVTSEATTARLIPATTGDRIVGMALTTGGDGEKISVLLSPGYAAAEPA